MKVAFSLVFMFLSLCTSVTYAQSDEVNDSVPRDVLAAFNTISFWESYRVDYRINPFYLRADFDGDAKADFAVLCTRKKDGARFIAVVLSKTRTTVFVALDPEKQMDGWEVLPKSTVTRPDYDGAKAPPKLLGDAILLKFSITLLLYWDGSKFGTYMMND
jgi:hypothetical protein